MIRSLLLSISLLALGAGENPQKPSDISPTYGKPAETFVTGCDLILFGKDVPKVMENGQWGYKVVKRADAVLVNGIVYVDKPYELPKMINIDPEIARDAAVCEAAIEYLRSATELRSKEMVTVAGADHPLGVPFSLTVPGGDDVVEVTFNPDQKTVKLKCRKAEGTFQIARPNPPPPPLPYEVRLENQLDSKYQGLLTDLRPGFLIIKSGSVTEYHPLNRAAEVRASLARIPGRAKFLYVNSYGQPIYEGIQDGDFLWGPSIIADVVNAAKEGGR